MPLNKSLITTLSNVGGRIRIRNALNPVLGICIIVGLMYSHCLAIGKEPPFLLNFLLLITITGAMAGYFYLLIVDRDRLQSEDYQLRKQTLELIENKGSRKAIDASIVQVISQNELSSLPLADNSTQPEEVQK